MYTGSVALLIYLFKCNFKKEFQRFGMKFLPNCYKQFPKPIQATLMNT